MFSAARALPPASEEADREDSPQEALQTPSCYACEPSALQAPQPSCLQEETTPWGFFLNQVLKTAISVEHVQDTSRAGEEHARL